MMMAAAVAAVMLGDAPTALMDYLARHKGGFAYRSVKDEPFRKDIQLASQTWQGKPWQHDIVLIKPKTPIKEDTAILVVTGDRVDAKDIPFAQKLADQSGLAVATIFKVPNQPLFDKSEDELIAHTFERYMNTDDEEWPLLFPMVKSVWSAMDTLNHYGFKKFVVTGASKRGWTTWLAGETKDPRIIGIAPVVFDNLNFGAQLKHQLERYGKFSEMIGDYVAEGLTEAINTTEGQKLAAMVDPFSYLARLRVPVLAIMGTNDRYWTVDSHKLYWDAIPSRKNLLMLPNEGHGFSDSTQYIRSLSAFAKSCAGVQAWPELNFKFSPETVEVTTDGVRPVKTTLWAAESANMDFRDSKWRSIGGGSVKAGEKTSRLTYKKPEVNIALFVAVEVITGVRDSYTLSSQVQVIGR